MDEELERFRRDLRQQLLVWSWPKVVVVVEELGVALVVRGVWTMRAFREVLEGIERIRRWEDALRVRRAEENQLGDHART